MPIIEVLLVIGADEQYSSGLAQRLANTIGSAMDASPGNVWVRLETLPSVNYAENASTLSQDELPVFVSVLHATPPSGIELKTEVAKITNAVAQATERHSERVHIEYAPPGAGRVSFGGRLVE
jgi:phenylpyruvate tautomerase PptA (4-oxalocrotonate tautomerase family)